MNRKGAAEIDGEAAEWVARLDANPPGSPDLLLRFERWLAENPRHRGAYVRAQAAWHLLERGAALGTGAEAITDADLAASWRMPLSRRMLLAGSAAAAVAAGAGFVYFRPEGRAERYVTQRGEIRRVPFADGSVAMLNTATDLDFTLRASERLVTMRSGEGWFKVAKDRDRTFIVDTGIARVLAVGTAFAVRRIDDRMEVMVSEGTVRLAGITDSANAPLLHAGGKAVIDPGGHVRLSTLTSAELTRQLAWRGGGLGLDGETVAEAAAQFNRYNHRQIIVASGPLAAEKIVGWFDVNDPDGFAESVSLTFNAGVRVEGDRLYLEEKRKNN